MYVHRVLNNKPHNIHMDIFTNRIEKKIYEFWIINHPINNKNDKMVHVQLY